MPGTFTFYSIELRTPARGMTSTTMRRQNLMSYCNFGGKRFSNGNEVDVKHNENSHKKTKALPCDGLNLKTAFFGSFPLRKFGIT